MSSQFSSREGSPWGTSDLDFLREHYGKMSVREIAERLGRTFGTVKTRAYKLGLTVSRGKDWTEAEDAYLKANYGTTPADEITQRLGRTRGSVKRHAGRLGLATEEARVRTERRAAIRHDYFSVTDTPLKAYILGWLATDGFVTDGGIGIRLSVKDADVVKLIRGELAPLHKFSRVEGRAHEYQGRTITGGPSVGLQFQSAQMREDLGQLGVTPRKSHTLRYPQLPSHLQNSFILGCFEGDGTLCRGNGRWMWHLCSASVPFLLAVQSCVQDAIGVELRGPHRAKSIHMLTCTNQQYIRVLDAWLHADITGLPRKHLSERER